MRQGEGVRVAFLLVGEDLATGVERASGLETLISVNGGAFRPTAGEAGGGRRGVVRGRSDGRGDGNAGAADLPGVGG